MPASAEFLRAELRARIALIESGAQGEKEPASPSLTSCDPTSGRQARAQGESRSEEQERAFRKILALCRPRERASEELRMRLAGAGFSDAAAAVALERARACGLVDDRRFAEVLVRSRLAQGRGRVGIAAELARLGIACEGLEGLDDPGADDSSEIERAIELLNRKPPQAKNRRKAAYRRLAQKGFASSVCASAARRWSEERPAGPGPSYL